MCSTNSPGSLFSISVRVLTRLLSLLLACCKRALRQPQWLAHSWINLQRWKIIRPITKRITWNNPTYLHHSYHMLTCLRHTSYNCLDGCLTMTWLQLLTAHVVWPNPTDAFGSSSSSPTISPCSCPENIGLATLAGLLGDGTTEGGWAFWPYGTICISEASNIRPRSAMRAVHKS